MSVIKTKFSTLTLNTDSIFKEIEKHELIRRRDAAKAATKVMKQNVNSKGKSTPGDFPSRRIGRLFKSIKYKLLKEDRSAAVGTSDSKAHLLEFGHGDGKEKNKRPFVRKSLIEAEDEVIRIMSEPYF